MYVVSDDSIEDCIKSRWRSESSERIVPAPGMLSIRQISGMKLKNVLLSYDCDSSDI